MGLHSSSVYLYVYDNIMLIINIALSYSLKSGSLIPSALFFSQDNFDSSEVCVCVGGVHMHEYIIILNHFFHRCIVFVGIFPKKSYKHMCEKILTTTINY